MAKSQTTYVLVVLAAVGAIVGCSGGNQDGELPKNDPIIGKPADTGSAKDPNAPRSAEGGGTKPGFGK